MTADAKMQPVSGSPGEGLSRADVSWQVASRRVARLQRIQLLTILSLAVVVVVSAFFMGTLYVASSAQHEEREHENLELVEVRDQVRSLQVVVLRRELAGDTVFTPERVLEVGAMATRVEEIAGKARPRESGAERDARLAVNRLVDRYRDEYAAAASPQAFGSVLTGSLGEALLDEYFAVFNTWVKVHGEALSEETRDQRAQIVSVGIGLLVVLLLLIGLGLVIWWRIERERERVVARARRESRRFDSLVENASDLMMVMSGAGLLEYCSPSATRLLGRSPEDLKNRPLNSLVHPDDIHRLRVVISDELDDGDISKPIEVRLLHGDATWSYTEVLVRNLVNDPEVRGFVLNCRDVSDRKEIENQLAHQAFHDPLTGLPNRLLFEDRLDQALSRRDDDGGMVGVLLLDLDDFKTVNDSLGHTTGDELLGIAGQRLLRAIRPGDTAARLGGDEYAVVLEGITGPVSAQEAAARIANALATPVILGESEITPKASIGIAFAPQHGSDPETLLGNADIAMYEAKASSQGSIATFHPGMKDAIEERMSLSVDLHRAVERGDQLRVVYQQIVDLWNGRVTGFEALLRWQHPVVGDISPTKFIPISGRSGLIIPIGAFVLREACRKAARWNADLAATERLSISVNVSPRQLEDADFLDVVTDALKESGLPAANLVLEVTESAVMGDLDRTIELLARIKALGVRIAIDDFGTGYSSLSQLSRLPVDVVKIDRAFVQALSVGEADTHIAGVIVQLGSVLNLTTVAEGIEAFEQVQELRAFGCRFGQGFFFAEPMEAEVISAMLAGAPQVPVMCLVGVPT